MVTGADASGWVSQWQSSSDASIDWGACEEAPEAECATMTVPVDWTDRGGETIDIPLRRYLSADETAPVLLLVPGGPGGSGTQLVTDIGEDAAQLRQDFTLLSFDPRGVWGPQGGDHPLDCPAQAEGCEASTALARHASTSDVAMDVENLRISLGDAPLRAVSYSYGTYIAGVYVTLFPESASRMVFDGAAPSFGFTPLGTERQSIAFEEALDRFIDECLDGEFGECPLSGNGDTAKGQLIALRADLDEEPATVSLDDEDVVLDGDAFRARVLEELYRPRSEWIGITELLRVTLAAMPQSASGGAGAAGAAKAFERRAADADDDAGSGVAHGIAQAVMCAMPEATDPVSREDLEPLHGEEYFFISDSGDAASDAAAALACAAELPAHLDPVISYTGPETFLVTSTTGDPATPFSDAATLADQLNASLLAVEAEGHTSVFGQSSCSSAAALAYLTQGVLPADDAVCAG